MQLRALAKGVHLKMDKKQNKGQRGRRIWEGSKIMSSKPYLLYQTVKENFVMCQRKLSSRPVMALTSIKVFFSSHNT